MASEAVEVEVEVEKETRLVEGWWVICLEMR